MGRPVTPLFISIFLYNKTEDEIGGPASPKKFAEVVVVGLRTCKQQHTDANIARAPLRLQHCDGSAQSQTAGWVGGEKKNGA